MKDILTLALMCSVVLRTHGSDSLTIDTTNCSRTNPMSVMLQNEQNLTRDLRSLGYHLNPDVSLLAYSVFDNSSIVQLFVNVATKLYFIVYGNSISNVDYICAENITYDLYGKLISDCEQPFVLNVELDDCLILNREESTVKDKEEIRKKLSGMKDDSTPVTEVLLDSNKNTFSVYFVDSKPPQYFGLQQHKNSKRPHLISESEYTTYMERCKAESVTA